MKLELFGKLLAMHINKSLSASLQGFQAKLSECQGGSLKTISGLFVEPKKWTSCPKYNFKYCFLYYRMKQCLVLAQDCLRSFPANQWHQDFNSTPAFLQGFQHSSLEGATDHKANWVCFFVFGKQSLLSDLPWLICGKASTVQS